MKNPLLNSLKKYIISSSFNEDEITKQILLFDFETVYEPKLNSFNSDDLSSFIKIYSDGIYFHNDEIQKLFSQLIFFERKVLNINLDLKSIDSVFASKSLGKDYDTMYLFGKNVYVDRNDRWSFDECIKHITEDEPFDIYYYLWNDRYAWVNANGSHHLAVANFLATNEHIVHNLVCNVTIKKINNEIAIKILKDFEMFIIHNEIKYTLKKILGKDNILMYDLNSQNTLILFDKNNQIFDKLIRLLKIIDNQYILNLNDYLINRLTNQTKYEQNKSHHF